MNNGRYTVKRKRQRNIRREIKSRRLFSIVAWTASFLMVLTMLPEDSPAVQKLAALEAAVPVISLEFEELAAGPEEKQTFADTEKVKNNNDDSNANILSEDISGEMQIVVSENIESSGSENDSTQENNMILVSDIKTETDQTVASILKNEVVTTTNTSSVTGKGNIIIYHTHATEAYMPISATSTHVTQTEGTVREAGNQLTDALKAKGFSVVHDITLHDNPSYNKSYNRSLETAKKLISQYGDLQMIVDMHRDAASSVNGKPKTAVIDGQEIASFSLVVGTKNENYTEIRAFAEKIVNKANQMYPGFCTGIIERPYKFNGYLSDRYILLELGNDANTIEQVNTSTIYLADVFANVLKDM